MAQLCVVIIAATVALFGLALAQVQLAPAEGKVDPIVASAVLFQPLDQSTGIPWVGFANFNQTKPPHGDIQVTVQLYNRPGGYSFKPGLHGFHVHALGNILPNCEASGSHFNPFKQTHGSRTSKIRHIGDMGNIHITSAQTSVFGFKMAGDNLPLSGANSIIGRTLVLHRDVDDLGLGGTNVSLTTGNAGPRIACGVIGYGGVNLTALEQPKRI